MVAENRIYFSLAGEASLTMFRDGQSQVFTSPHKGAGVQHPYHTFDSLISGELRPGDGLLLAGGELHYFLPPHTLERERNRLSEERFIQMLTTALHNETSLSCVYVGTVSARTVVAPVIFEPEKEVLSGMPSVNALVPPPSSPKGQNVAHSLVASQVKCYQKKSWKRVLLCLPPTKATTTYGVMKT